MAMVAVAGGSMGLQACDGCCKCIGSCIDGIKRLAIAIFNGFTKIVTCGQGWKGLVFNTISIFNSEEDIDRKDFDLPEAENRFMTDFPFFALLCLMLIGMMVVMNRAIAYGRPEVHFKGVDVFGNICGVENEQIEGVDDSGRNMEKYNLVLLFDFMTRARAVLDGNIETIGMITSKVILCVSTCPLVSKSIVCRTYFKENSAYSPAVFDTLCGAVYTGNDQLKNDESLSFSIQNSRCVPDTLTETTSTGKQSQMMALYSANWVHNLISDCGTCAAELTWLTLIAIGFTLLIICVFQGASPALCWFSFALFALVGIGSTSYLWYLYSVIRAEDDTDLLYSEEENFTTGEILGDDIFAGTRSRVPQAGYSVVFRDASIIVTTIVGFGICVCSTVGGRNMEAASTLFTEAVTGMIALRWVYILPLITVAALSLSTGLVFFTVNLLTAVFSDEIVIESHKIHRFTTVKISEDSKFTTWLLLFEVVAFTWLVNFLVSCQNIVVNGAIANWYFTKDKTDMARPVRLANSRLFQKHLGSAAAGGLMIGFFGWMRAPFSFMQSRLNRALVEEEEEEEEYGSLYSGVYSKGKKGSQARSYSGAYSRDVESGSKGSKGLINKQAQKGKPTTQPAQNKNPRPSKGPDKMYYTDEEGKYTGENSYSYSEYEKEPPKKKSNSKSELGKGLNKKKVSLPEIPVTKQPTKTNSKSYGGTYSSRNSRKSKDKPETTDWGKEITLCLAKMCLPCFWVLNNMLVYISDLNLSMVAVKGYSFFVSGFEIRRILVEDPKLKGLGAISSFSIFLGKLSVTIAVLPFGFLLLKDKEGVFIYGYPLAVGGMLALLIAHVFLSMFNAAVCTIFVCFMEDRSLNDGSKDFPFFGSENLFKKMYEVLGDELNPEGKRLYHAHEFVVPKEEKKSDYTVNDKSYSTGFGSNQYSRLTIDRQPKSKKPRGNKTESDEYSQDFKPSDPSSMFLLMPKKGDQKTKQEEVEESEESYGLRNLLGGIGEDDSESEDEDDDVDDEEDDDDDQDDDREKKEKKKKDKERKKKEKEEKKRKKEQEKKEKAKKKQEEKNKKKQEAEKGKQKDKNKKDAKDKNKSENKNKGKEGKKDGKAKKDNSKADKKPGGKNKAEAKGRSNTPGEKPDAKAKNKTPAKGMTGTTGSSTRMPMKHSQTKNLGGGSKTGRDQGKGSKMGTFDKMKKKGLGFGKKKNILAKSDKKEKDKKKGLGFGKIGAKKTDGGSGKKKGLGAKLKGLKPGGKNKNLDGSKPKKSMLGLGKMKGLKMGKIGGGIGKMKGKLGKLKGKKGGKLGKLKGKMGKLKKGKKGKR